MPTTRSSAARKETHESQKSTIENVSDQHKRKRKAPPAAVLSEKKTKIRKKGDDANCKETEINQSDDQMIVVGEDSNKLINSNQTNYKRKATSPIELGEKQAKIRKNGDNHNSDETEENLKDNRLSVNFVTVAQNSMGCYTIELDLCMNAQKTIFHSYINQQLVPIAEVDYLEDQLMVVPMVEYMKMMTSGGITVSQLMIMGNEGVSAISSRGIVEIQGNFYIRNLFFIDAYKIRINTSTEIITEHCIFNGVNFNFSGKLTANSSCNVHTKEIYFSARSEVKAEELTLIGTEKIVFDKKCEIQINKKGTFTSDQFLHKGKIENRGILQCCNMSRIKLQGSVTEGVVSIHGNFECKISGKLQKLQSLCIDIPKLDITDSSTLNEINNLLIKSKTIRFSGQASNIHHMEVDANEIIVVEHFNYKVESALLIAETMIFDGTIYAGKYLEILVSKNAKMQSHTNISAENISVSGFLKEDQIIRKIAMKFLQIEQDSYFSSTQHILLQAELLSCEAVLKGIACTMVGENIELGAECYIDAMRELHISANQTLTFSNNRLLALDSACVLHANKVIFEGLLACKERSSIKSEAVHFKKDSQWEGGDSIIVNATDMILEGKINGGKIQFFIDKTCRLTESAVVESETLSLTALSMVDGKPSFSEMEDLIFSKSAKISTKTGLLFYANNIDCDGEVSTKTFEIKCKDFNIQENFLAREVETLRVEASNCIKLNNQDEFNVTDKATLISSEIQHNSVLRAGMNLQIKSQKIDTAKTSGLYSPGTIQIASDTGNFHGEQRGNNISYEIQKLVVQKSSKFFAENILFIKADDMTIQGELDSLIQVLILESTNSITIGKFSKCKGKKKIAMQGKEIHVNGSITSQGDLMFQGDRIDFASSSQIDVENEATLKSNLVKVGGNFSSKGNIVLGCKNIFFKGHAIISAQDLIMSSSTIFNRGVINAKKIMVENEGLIELQKGYWKAEETCVLKANEIKVNTRLESKQDLILTANSNVSVDLNGRILATQNIQIEGWGLWSRGVIEAENGDLSIAVDTVCSNGFLVADSIKNVFSVVGSKMCGNNVTIVSGFFFLLPGCILKSVSTTTILSMVTLNLCGISLHWRSNKTQLVNFEYGINLTNPEAITTFLRNCKDNLPDLKALKAFLGRALQGDFSFSLNSQQNKRTTRSQEKNFLMNIVEKTESIISMIVPATKLFMPGISIIVNTGWNMLRITLQANKIYGELSKLFDRERVKPIHFREIIPILASGVTLAQTLISSYKIINDICTEYFTEEGELKPISFDLAEFDQALFKQFLEMTKFILIPSNFSTSLLDCNGGVMLAGNINRLNLYNYTSLTSVEAAMMISNTFCHSSDSGTKFAQGIVMEGHSLEQGGSWNSEKLYVNLSTELLQQHQAKMNAVSATIKVPTFDQHGVTNFDEAKITVSTLHTIREQAKVLLGEFSQYHAASQALAGDFIAEKSNLQIGQQTLTGASHFEASESYCNIEETIMESGEYFLKHSLLTGHNFQQNGGDVSLHGTQMDLDENYQGEKGSHLSLEESLLTAKTAILDNENVDMKEAEIDTKEYLTVREGTQLTAENAALRSRDIDYNGQGNVDKGLLVMDASNRLSVAETSSIDGQGGAYLSCNSGSLDGRINTSSLHYKNNTFKDTTALLNGEDGYAKVNPTESLTIETRESVEIDRHIDRGVDSTVIASSVEISADCSLGEHDLAFVATQGDVNANADLHARNLSLVSLNGDVNTSNHSTTASKNVDIYAKENVNNTRNHIDAENVSIVAEKGDVTNYAGKISSQKNTSLYAGADVKNVASETDVQTPHGTMKSYTPGQILGGTGEGHEGVGNSIYAGNKVINDGSQIHSVGSNVVVGKNGVEMISRANTYCSGSETHRKWYGKKVTTFTYGTQIQRPTLSSEQGGNTIYSAEGTVKTVGADISAKDGTDICSKGKVELLNVTGESKIHEEKKFLWERKVHDETHETSVSTSIANTNPGYIRIHSLEDDVIGVGLKISNPGGKTEISGKDVLLSAPVLNHTVHTQKTGLQLSVFGRTIIGDNSDSSILTPDQTLIQLTQLANSHHIDELALNAMNTAINLTDTLNTLTSAAADGNMVNAIANRAGIQTTPSATLTHYSQSSDTQYQTLGDAGIDSGELSIHAKGKVVLQSMPVNVVNMNVQAKEFLEKGTALYYSTRQHSHSTSFTVSGPEKYDVGISHSQSSSHGKQMSVQTTNVRGIMTVNAEQWYKQDAVGVAGKLEGSVDKMILETTLSEHHSRNKSYHASTTGAVGFNKGKSNETYISSATQMHVTGDIDDAFQVKDVQLIGSKITTDGVNGLSAEAISSTAVQTSSHSSQKGLSTNLTFFGNSSSSSSPSSSAIPTANVSFQNAHKVGEQQSVLYGEKGTNTTATILGKLHTSSSDGQETLYERSRNLTANIPVSLEKAKEIFTKVWKSPDTSTSNHFQELLSELQKRHPSLTLDQLRDQANLMLSFSEAVYEKDYGEKILNELGYELVGTYVDKDTDTVVAVYINSDTKDGCVAFQGSTGKAWITDDLKILTGKEPTSVLNPQMTTFLDAQLKTYEEYNFLFTGHSRGAVQAAIMSDHYDMPAMVFDNPGVSSEQHYTFDKVISFQSTPNFVNSMDHILGRPINYGSVIPLIAPASEQVLTNVAQALSSAIGTPTSAIVDLMGQTYFSHSSSFVENRIEETFDKMEDCAP